MQCYPELSPDQYVGFIEAVDVTESKGTTLTGQNRSIAAALQLTRYLSFAISGTR